MNNHVELQGRLTAPPDVRTLSSGDDLVLLRVAVARGDASRVDSVPVVVGPVGKRRRPGCAGRPTLRAAAAASAGDEVAVTGWLQRRFWQAPDGRRGSRVEVVAVEFRPVRSPERQPAGSA